MTAIECRHCRVQRKIHYYLTRYNNGQSLFEPGDDIWMSTDDFPRAERQNKVVALEKNTQEIEPMPIDIFDLFPKKGREIWVFGDGPTATIAKNLPSENAITFGVNRCFFEQKQDGSPALGLVPDYFVALDDGTMMMEERKIKELASPRKFTKSGNSTSSKWTWPELRLFDVRGEDGFSIDPPMVYHGKTSAYCALQLAVQCGLAYYPADELDIHLAGIDLAVMHKEDGDIISHHYGHRPYETTLFGRMLTAFRYGLNFLNEIGISWTNHSPLLAGRIEDLI